MTRKGPWTVLGTKQVYSNPWITVREDQVICPDGSAGIYGVVEPRLATGVLAITPSKEIYLVGQYRYAMEQYSWEIIEGGVDDGEEPLAAAKRELREEAGIVAARFEPFGDEVHLSNCHSSERAFLFLAQDLTEVEAEPDYNEDLSVKRVTIAEALRMADSGEIKDALSLVALYRLARHLG